MKELSQNHHAYAIEGVDVKELLDVIERKWEVATRGNPDFSYEIFGTLGIGEARALNARAQSKSFSEGRKIFVIEAEAITHEAQNALLKMFEEPTANTHFFLLGRCVRNLLPTLASRLWRVRAEAPRSLERDGAEKFLALTVAKRLEEVKKLADDIKDEKKTKADALRLLEDIEKFLYEKARQEKKLPDKTLTEIEMCRDYMTDRSAGVKMLIEYVALICPKH